MSILVTGAAGFIGYHVAAALLDRGEEVIGVDVVNSYYDVALKEARLGLLAGRRGFSFTRLDLADRDSFGALVAARPGITAIVHLAAQAGVRHSLIDPHAYVSANVMGHLVVLEAARRMKGLRHLVYASSSSVYGGTETLPFAEADRADTPLSLYAATKRADELFSYAYAHLFAIPQTGLRFFTVYGPWGRPDMAYYSFAQAIMEGRAITVYDGGEMRRDFTYIADAVRAVLALVDLPPEGAPRVVNIGNHRSERVMTLIGLLEAALDRRALIVDAPRPPADVVETCADVEALRGLVGFSPATPLGEGIGAFAAWFRAWQAEGARGAGAG